MLTTLVDEYGDTGIIQPGSDPQPEPEVKADTNDRRTPRWFFKQCEARFGPFDVDMAANAENALCDDYVSEDGGHGDGRGALGINWCWANFDIVTVHTQPLRVWCNPPYAPPGTIARWIAKARQERDAHGTRTLMLLPSDTSTDWYHDVTSSELCELVKFRLAFESPDGSTKGNSAKFGSVLVYIAPKIQRPKALKGR